MHFLDKTINGIDKKVLEVAIYDEEDVREVKLHYSKCDCIQIDMNSLVYLQLFQHIKTLILTGGVPSSEGLERLYKQKEVIMLVLDFEETDSDEEGIDLSRFPNLEYVLSRSNLNIHKYENVDPKNVCIEILNFYKDGKALRVDYESNYDIFQKNKFLFFSTESKTPASTIIINILKPIETVFEECFQDISFSKNLDSIAIIPICLPNLMLEQGFGKERKRVSMKKREADIRLQISYENFLLGNEMERVRFCKENIEKASEYISKKDKTFALQEFLNAIDYALKKVYDSL